MGGGSQPVPQRLNQARLADTGFADNQDHLAFAVSDEGALRAWAEYLSASGIDHPGVVPENGNPSLQLRDPDGIAIEMVTSGRPNN